MAVREPYRLSETVTTAEAGVDSGLDPSLIQTNQIAWGRNLSLRGAQIRQRDGFRQIRFTGSSVIDIQRYPFQGVSFFQDQANVGSFMLFAGGRTYKTKVDALSMLVTEVSISTDLNSPNARKIFAEQAGDYLVIQDGSSKPLIWDGSNLRRAAHDEVPIGSGPMAFGKGRLWVAQGLNYVAGDIEGGPTGVLKFTENTYFNEGGSFPIPIRSGPITGMVFTASPDTSLGQGELLITAGDSVFSNVLPTERDTWKDLRDPVQRIIVLNNGSLSDSIPLVNGDAYIRSREGMFSVIQAVRDYSSPGNVPVSREMNRIYSRDPDDLLNYYSSIYFKNRLISTTDARYDRHGAVFKALGVLDFDLVSSSRTKLPPAWDGIWDGYDFLRLWKGRIRNTDRAFFAAKNPNKGFVSSIIVAEEGIYGTFDTPTLTVQDFDGGSSTLEVVPHFCWKDPVTIVNGGTGYAVGDIFKTSVAGSLKEAAYAVATVGGGGVVLTANQIAGQYGDWLTKQNGPVATTTTGSGTGLTLGNQCRLFKIEPKKLTDLPRIVAAGSGYAVGQILTVTGPSPKASDAQYKIETVTGGTGVLTISQVAGKYGEYANRPMGTLATTGGTGTGCTLKMPGSPAVFKINEAPKIIGTGGLVAYPVLDFEWEIWEIIPESLFDMRLDDEWNLNEERITWSFESRYMSFATNGNVLARDLKRLIGAELWIDEIVGSVNCSLEYKPNRHPCWQAWHSWEHEAQYKLCVDATDCKIPMFQKQNRPRVGIPPPPAACNSNSKQTMDYGRGFEARLTVTGPATIRLLELVANDVPEETHPECAPADEPSTSLECNSCAEL